MVRLAFHVMKHHRAAAIHVLLQPGDLKVGIDLLVGFDQVAFGAQPFERRTQVARTRAGGLIHRLFGGRLRPWGVVLVRGLLHVEKLRAFFL